MRDLAALATLPSIQIAQLAGFGGDGLPVVRLADGKQFTAHSLVPLGPASINREVAVARMDGDLMLVLGLLDPPPVMIEADGERIVIDAEREVVLRCGKASVTLRADGRIVLRGTEILSRASGANRIQGGSVQLN